MRKTEILLVALLAAGGLSGCWPLFTPIEPAQTTPPHATQINPPSAALHTQAESEPSERTKRKRISRSRPPAQPSEADAKTPSQDSTDRSKPSLTLAGEDDSKQSAELLLKKVDRQLTSIDRNKLSASDAATYEQANDFASSAHQALAAHDYVVASGLAEKASLLSGRLNATNSAP